MTSVELLRDGAATLRRLREPEPRRPGEPADRAVTRALALDLHAHMLAMLLEQRADELERRSRRRKDR